MRKFISDYEESKGTYHLWFCSEQFRNKFQRNDFRSPVEIKGFRGIIEKITLTSKDYPTETIGEFFISPRGHNPHRIVWFIKKNAVYFCEPFNDHEEYDNFCDGARQGNIKRKNYFGWDYIERFTPLNLKAA